MEVDANVQEGILCLNGSYHYEWDNDSTDSTG